MFSVIIYLIRKISKRKRHQGFRGSLIIIKVFEGYQWAIIVKRKTAMMNDE